MKNKSKIFRRFEFSQKFFRFLLVDRLMIRKDNLVLVTGKRGDGKCQIKGSKVLMANGEWKNIEDINVGEEVISPQEDGSTIFSKVINTHNRFEEEIYDIVEATRDKRKLYSCAWNHEIPMIVPVSKRTSKNDSTPRERSRKVKIWNAKKISKSKWHIGSHMCSFTTPAIEYKDHKDSAIEPYSLGVFLGDGSFTSKRRKIKRDGKVLNILNRSMTITSVDFNILEEISKTYPIMSIAKSGNRAPSYRFSINGEFSQELMRLGLEGKGSGTKFIPKECLLSSIEYRRKLLAGLIDTDGFISKNNQITICTKSKRLAEGIKNLVLSIGGYSLVRNIYKNCQTFREKRLYYDVAVQFEDPRIIPLKLDRKRKRLRKRKINPRNIAITAVRGKPSEIYGIELEEGSKWYITDNHMVTHNTTIALKIILGFSNFDKLEEYYNLEVNKYVEKKKKYNLKGLQPFNIEKDMAFTKKALQELCKENRKGFILADEAIVNVARRNSMTRANKILHEVLTINRKNANTIFFCLPSIEDFDISILQYVTHWIHIDDRGLGCILMPESKSIFGRKTWDVDRMKKIYDKFLEENPTVLSVPYWIFDNFRGYIRFKKLTKLVEERYLKIAHEKKNVESDSEEVKKKEPRIPKEKMAILYRLADRLIKGDITDSAEYYAHCAEMGFKKDKLNREINEILAKKGDGRTSSKVLKDNKEKEEASYEKQIQNKPIIY